MSHESQALPDLLGYQMEQQLQQQEQQLQQQQQQHTLQPQQQHLHQQVQNGSQHHHPLTPHSTSSASPPATITGTAAATFIAATPVSPAVYSTICQPYAQKQSNFGPIYHRNAAAGAAAHGHGHGHRHGHRHGHSPYARVYYKRKASPDCAPLRNPNPH